MDAQHKRLVHLLDSIHQLGQKMTPKGGGGRDLEKIETLQDRWDALSLIMDMQAERVSVIGFIILNKVFNSVTNFSFEFV